MSIVEKQKVVCSFNELKISKEILDAIGEMGFEKPSPIQAQAIPVVMSGKDVIGQASTGTGKTAAFGIPAIEKVDEKSKDVQVLVLCPTRELAIQVSVEMNKFLKYKKRIFALPIYGGQPISRQITSIRRKKPQIIIGTPGRILDHIERQTLSLENVTTVVLDEADEMLDMGFRHDLERILRKTSRQKQTVLFSATMSKDVLAITKKYQKKPEFIKVAEKKISAATIDQKYFHVEPSDKKNLLPQLLDEYSPKRALVFCNTKRKVDKVAKILRDLGYRSAAIHGDIRQAKRDRIMSRFRGGKIDILVATDVAARGIDVSDLEIVFNYEIPRETESYVHRIGRTGRAGKAGLALSFVSHSEFGRLKDIQRYTKANIERLDFFVPHNMHDVKHDVKKVLPSTQEKVSCKKKDFKKDFSRKEKRAHKHLQEDASRVFGKVRQSLVKDELSGYLKAMEHQIGDKHCLKEVAAALFKMAIEYN